MSTNPFLPDLDETELALERIEPAWADAAHALRTGHRVTRLSDGQQSIRMLSLLAVHEMLKEYRRRAEADNGLAILEAVRYCSQENVPLPYWLGQALDAKLAAHASTEGPHSLDILFRDPALPVEGKKARTVRVLHEPAVRLYRAVEARRAAEIIKAEADHREPRLSIDDAIRAELKDGNYRFKLTKARALYEELADSQGRWLAAVRLSRFSPKRAKPRKRVIR